LPLLATQTWLQRHAPALLGTAIILAMSISLAWQSADWLRLLRAPVAAANSTASETAAIVAPPAIGQLFGSSSPASNGPVPSTNLRLTLLGSFVHADPKRSSAIIRSEGSTAQRYTIDSEISSGVRLHAVAADGVELLRNGRRESLSFPLNSSTAGSTQVIVDDPLEQLSEMESEDLSQLRERMDALRQQMQDSSSLPGNQPGATEPTEQPMENN
jgi:general secretion pathway protein C